MQFTVEIEPFIGMAPHKLGMVPVQHPFDRVFVVGQDVADALGNRRVCVGYAPHLTDTVDFLPHVRNLGPDAPGLITAEVSRLTGRSRAPALPPQPVNGPGRVSTPLDLDRPATRPVLDLG